MCDICITVMSLCFNFNIILISLEITTHVFSMTWNLFTREIEFNVIMRYFNIKNVHYEVTFYYCKRFRCWNYHVYFKLHTYTQFYKLVSNIDHSNNKEHLFYFFIIISI